MNCTLPSIEAQSSLFNFSAEGFSISEEVQVSFTWFEVIQMVTYICVMVLSLLGNLPLRLAITTQRSMRTTINYYLLNMALADMLIVIFCMWVHFMNAYIYQESYKLGAFMCRIETFAKSK